MDQFALGFEHVGVLALPDLQRGLLDGTARLPGAVSISAR
jgi:hypothetical protein